MTSDEERNKELKELLTTTMPFGKYKGRLLIRLPEPYLVWFSKQGFPAGKLGHQLRIIHEIKINGLETMLEPLAKELLKGGE